MDDFWIILGLEATQDISAIKRTYAQKTKTCHPEENPQEFMKLRKAYQAALAYAEKDTGNTGSFTNTAVETSIDITSDSDDDKEAEDNGWTLSGNPKQQLGENPYADHEAIQSFLTLYTGKQRKDQKRWLDYFTSDAFLNAAWDRRFTALLLEHITRLEGEYPVNREFLIGLCVAYQFTVSRAVYLNPDGSERTEFDFQMRPEARFDGQESVFEIAAKGPFPKRLKGNELAVFESFTEYHQLADMAEKGIWSEQEIGKCSEIIGCYVAGYITDKCQQRGDVDCERHPAGLRLITHFFRRDGLPEELYRIAWQKLDLETAVMGKAKILYGALRELVLKRLPQLSGQPKESFAKLRTDFTDYAVSTCKLHGENAQATEADIQKTDEFWAREDFQSALLNRRFVEEEMLHTWVNEDRCDYYLKKVIQFYKEHGTAPCAARVIARANEMLKIQEVADRIKQDRESASARNAATLKSSPFFRHWLNTGFYQARDLESGRSLLEYLNQELPYLPEWSREFLEVTDETIFPKSFTYTLGADTVEVRFHLRYMAFFVNQNPVYRACLEWERVFELTDTDMFFFSLPVTATTYDHFQTVKTEILRRLEDTAAPKDSQSLIAACLAGQVCSLPLPGEAGLARDIDGKVPPESILPFEVFAEDTEHLYGCEWVEHSHALFLFEQLPIGRQILQNGVYDDVADARSAVALSRQILEETLSPPPIPTELLVYLPDAVYANPDFNVGCKDDRPVELSGEAVTRAKLAKLLMQFASDRLERLELSWNIAAPVGEELDYDTRRSLVFIKGGGGYACLYFDDFRAKSYALLKKPELYGKIKDNISLVAFRQSKLFHDVIHQGFSSIGRHLDVIFRQVSWPNNVDFMAGGIWDYAMNVFYGRSKYHLDKQLLGGFPMERAHNRLDAPFYFSFYPSSAACVDEQGDVEKMEIGTANKSKLQQTLIRFLKGDFCRLRMTWGTDAERREHIVLLQDSGRFVMAWIQEEKRTVQYHVADVKTYLDVEEKKYPKDTFQGRIIPAYLIHECVTALRNALELLLAELDESDTVTGKFAEYAGENPVKERPYEVLWAELVGDTLANK